MPRPFLAFLLFIGVSRALSQSIPNGSFESWSFQNGYSEPSGWVTNNDLALIYGSDYTATQELPGTDGDYYLKLSVQFAESISEVLPAKAFVGEYTFPSADTTNGFAVNQLSTVLEGDYRSFINTNDAATITCLFSKWNESANTTDTIAYGMRTITESASDWVQFAINLTIVASELPDTCRIMLYAGGTNSTVGTTLEIDNLHFTGNVGVDGPRQSSPFSAYPNPLIDCLHLDLRNMSGACDVFIYDSTGREFLHDRKNNTLQSIDLSHLPAGIYTLHIDDGKQRWSKSIFKE
jgi:hypothetical protein